MHQLAAVTAATTAGLTSGVYLAFTTMVLPALHRCDPQEAADTMRTVNERALRFPFMALFFGGAAASAVTLATVGGSGRAPLAIAGAGLALASFAVTIGVNVPLNNALAAGGRWGAFAQAWGRANLVRAALSAAGAACLAASLTR